ncbi:hypothetical protein [Hymenobacter persicinus]|uniref:Uncharacterized protein n=1 Tax=Hymenobacter persicinus TaxID=2025506 RepID=A0A4Q5LBV2_9BACT|nr:hypothetical protein [Hymenobacter persicinus]RYU78600.1 hypothetical protein EWM57_13225 [Hymenobacter persicinus]
MAAPVPSRPLYQRGTPAVWLPDTAKATAARPDTVQVQPAAGALTPDEDEKLTRKSALHIVGAIAVLTLTTLLLYNVRSR